MTESENFVSRWARLKRNTDIERRAEAGEETPGRFGADVSAGSAEVVVAQPQIDPAADEPFDPATLPSIEAITANTDIREFLQSRVPAELTRAALRQAWVSDPAIRDFIGIAENQWDFNDPNAIPGFGPLRDSNNVPALVARVMGKADNLAEMISETPLTVEQPLPDVTDCASADFNQSVQQSLDGSPSTSSISGLPDNKSGEGAATRINRGAEGDDSPRIRRTHGSALPRWNIG
jgi:hypothetical protein